MGKKALSLLELNGKRPSGVYAKNLQEIFFYFLVGGGGGCM